MDTRTQTKVLSELFRLPMLAVSPYFSIGSGALVHTSMALNAFITGFGLGSTHINVAGLLEDTTGQYTSAFNIPLSTGNTDTTSDILNLVNPAINAYCSLNLGASTDSITWLMSTILGARTYNFPSLAVNTSRQASTTQDADISATVDITTTLSLTGGTTGKVELKYADDSGFTTNVKTVQGYTNSNTGSLTIGLNISQIGSAALKGTVPAGKYYRLVTTNVTGSPTYGTPQIQEVLL